MSITTTSSATVSVPPPALLYSRSCVLPIQPVPADGASLFLDAANAGRSKTVLPGVVSVATAAPSAVTEIFWFETENE